MVIISTSATDVIIQALSPEFGLQLISILASHDGVGGSGSGGVAGGGVWAYDWSKKDDKANKTPITAMTARAMSPTRENLLNVMVSLLSKRGRYRAAASVSPVRMRTAPSMP